MSVAWQFVSAVVTTTGRGVITMRSECQSETACDAARQDPAYIRLRAIAMRCDLFRRRQVLHIFYVRCCAFKNRRTRRLRPASKK